MAYLKCHEAHKIIFWKGLSANFHFLQTVVLPILLHLWQSAMKPSEFIKWPDIRAGVQLHRAWTWNWVEARRETGAKIQRTKKRVQCCLRLRDQWSQRPLECPFQNPTLYSIIESLLLSSFCRIYTRKACSNYCCSGTKKLAYPCVETNRLTF